MAIECGSDVLMYGTMMMLADHTSPFLGVNEATYVCKLVCDIIGMKVRSAMKPRANFEVLRSRSYGYYASLVAN